jgi:hypothetical protein
MNEEFKRMMELAGLPTPETTTEENTTESLNENFVGLPAINNIFEREKTDYEIAFEHFTKGTSLNENMSDNEFESYLVDLFQSVDLGDEFEEGPQTITFEKIEYADEDLLGGENANMFEPAHQRLSSIGDLTIKDPMSGTPLTFSTEGEDIVVSFNTEDFPGLN